MIKREETVSDRERLEAEAASREACADAIGDAQPPAWLGARSTLPPGGGDEFDVRLHRRELHLLAGLLATMASNDVGGVAIEYHEEMARHAEQFQQMLDNPFGGWVERTGPELDVHRLILALRATWNGVMGPESLALFDHHVRQQGLQ